MRGENKGKGIQSLKQAGKVSEEGSGKAAPRISLMEHYFFLFFDFFFLQVRVVSLAICVCVGITV